MGHIPHVMHSGPSADRPQLPSPAPPPSQLLFGHEYTTALSLRKRNQPGVMTRLLRV